MKFLVLLLILFTSCANGEKSLEVERGNTRYGGYLAFASVSDPKSFNPVLAKETSTTSITGLIFEGLTRVNVYTKEAEPNLAKSWQIKRGGKEWVFYLREDVKWNDGVPFSADDVVFTFNSLIYNSKIPSSASDVLKVDGEPFKVEKIDDYSVRFTLSSNYAPFLMAMGTDILPKHILADVVKADKFNSFWTLDSTPSGIVGTGPFKLSRYIPGQLVELVRNEHYWKKDKDGNSLSYLKGVRFLVVPNSDTALLKFLDSEIDYYSLRGEDYAILKPEEKSKGFKIYEVGPAFGSSFITFNQNNSINPKTQETYIDKRKLEWFRDRRFREAVSYALDRSSIIDIVLNGFGYPQSGPLSPSSGYFYNSNIEEHGYDLDRAKELLSDIGFSDIDSDGILEDKSGEDVSFNLFTNAENNVRVKIAELIKEDLINVGIKVNFLPLEFNNLVTKLSSSYDWEAIILGFTGGIEPHFSSNIWLSSGHLHIWYPKQERPATSWEAEIDKLFKDGVQALGRKKRKSIYDSWQEIASRELPLIYTAIPESIFAVRDKFGNLDPNPYGGVFHNIEEIYIINKEE
ncbi:MAG: ABC transporter substrate-binding protein [Candidatus Kaelpia aquatica]|nr:ABC transporter substrate-binding protein [Candidatus Kaelpia aquatica]